MSNGGCATPNGNGPASNLLPKLIRNKGYEIMLFVTIQVSARPPPASRRLTHVNNPGIIKTVRAAEPRNYSHQPGIGYSHRRNPHERALAVPRSCLGLTVASNRPCRGLAPPIDHPCPTHSASLRSSSLRSPTGDRKSTRLNSRPLG